MLKHLAAVCFAMMLRFFPPRHRARYGAEMRAVFLREAGVLARQRGGWTALCFVVSTYIDLVASGWRERRHERARYSHTGGWSAGLGLDLRHAVRSLAGSRMFTLVCMLSIGIGVAINAAIVLIAKQTFDPPRAMQARADSVVRHRVRPQGITSVVLEGSAGERERARDEAVGKLEEEIADAATQGFDLDEYASAEVPDDSRPAAPLDLEFLDAVLSREDLMPPGIEVRALGRREYGYLAPGMACEIRVTTDASYYEEHTDSVELWSPGSPLFPNPQVAKVSSTTNEIRALLGSSA